MRQPRAVTILVGASLLGALGLTATAQGAPVAHSATDRAAHPAAAQLRDSNPFARRLKWAGRTFEVYPAGQRGPENVPLTNSANAAYVDSRGRLHLKIIKVDGVWRSVEMQSVATVKYGTYRMIVDTHTEKFSRNTVFGMFVYRPHTKKYTNEIDIEDSRFPRYLKAPNNAQFAVQPYDEPHHTLKYHIGAKDAPLYQSFTWLPSEPGEHKGTVSFQTRVGSTSHSRLIAHWTFHGNAVPTDSNMYLYFDLWLNKHHPPLDGTHTIIVRSLTYTPPN